MAPIDVLFIDLQQFRIIQILIQRVPAIFITHTIALALAKIAWGQTVVLQFNQRDIYVRDVSVIWLL